MEDRYLSKAKRVDNGEWIMTPLFYLQCKDEWKVIGNIFDNPDLLNKREETYCKGGNDYER